MRNFKTLDELHEYNNNSFEQVYGKIEDNRPENPFKENSWEAIKFNARPHDVFRLDWSSYDSLRFADTFLPYIKKAYKAKASYVFDGAELFKDSSRVQQELLPLTNSDTLITLISYTYPKEVMASQQKNKVQAAKHEVLLFLEVNEFNAVDVSFKFGENFKNYLKRMELEPSRVNNNDESPMI